MFGVNLETTGNNYILDEDLEEVLQELKIDYTQFYRGVVVDNLDATMKGRVKVRIPQIHGVEGEETFTPTNDIPWATCAIQPAGHNSGTFLPPNIGDTVFVTFEAGMQEFPIYFGGIYTIRKEDSSDNKGVASRKLFNERIAPVTTNDLPTEVKEGTERVIYKSLKGAVIYIDDQDGHEKIQITDQSGQSIIMESLSKDVLKRRGDTVGRNPKSQIVLTNSSGDSITLSHGKIHLKSANIILETDNFVQKKSSEDFTDEENMANIILGENI